MKQTQRRRLNAVASHLGADIATTSSLAGLQACDTSTSGRSDPPQRPKSSYERWGEPCSMHMQGRSGRRSLCVWTIILQHITAKLPYACAGYTGKCPRSPQHGGRSHQCTRSCCRK